MKLLSIFFYADPYPSLQKKSLFLSGCKINQNMEFGDVIYFVLLVFFVILGFFKDSRKKRQLQRQMEAEYRPLTGEEEEMDGWVRPRESDRYSPVPPPLPPASAREGKGVHREFRSSADLVSIRDEQSSQPGYAFDYDANSFYEEDPDSPDASGDARKAAAEGFMHPLLGNPASEEGHEDLKKGLVYGEIIRRRY